ncbi:MAG: 4-amino-4-deoxy-L-arabinose transferase and related glycosyltransferase of family-like protein [Bryobacterales bacterium]|nr:4-amino-4-deoxy-L-arabinose transferase and related glycosyltransferase of family-like protein [Bryobacterales bacterium]
MRQAAAALFGAGFTVAACYAAGALLIDQLRAVLRRDERIPLAFVLGAACLHLLIFAILALRVAYWPVLAAVLAVTIAAALGTGAWRGIRTETGKPVAPLSKTLQVMFASCAGVFAIVYFVNAWAPETSPDGAGYHLALVARELRAHGFEPITNNLYAMLGAGVEMLFVPAFAIGRHSAAALVHFAFTIALALMMLAYGRRVGKPWAGAAGALLTFVSPIVGASGSSAYVDVATAAIVFAVFYWTEIWDEQHGLRLLIPVGLLAGYAYAAKYTAFPIAIYALGFVAWRSKRLRPVLIVAGCALIMAGPWIARNWIWYQNPLAPFGNWLFRNPYLHVIFEQDYAAWLRNYGMPSLRPLALETTIRGGYIGGIIGPAFLLLPVALVALRYRAGRRLLLAGALVFSTYFTNIGARFLIPCLPFFSLALGMALGEAAPFLAVLILFQAAASWPPVLNRYVNPGCWRLVRFPYYAALRITPQDEFLRENNSGYGVARMIEAKVPAGEPVLTMTGVPDSYTTHEILVSFQSAGNQALTDTVNMGWAAAFQPTVARVFQFPERKARRMRVVQTAQAAYPEQWNVHELRFYYHGQELPRRLEWRLRAWPNPWEVQMAFDNSLATRWRSQEVASPGMYLDADFGRDESVDEVRLITSSDFERIRLRVESMSPAGEWEKVAENPRLVSLAVPQGIRRMATYEMHARGVHYLMIYDVNYGADDFAEDPEAWGLKLIGRDYQARLYQTIW